MRIRTLREGIETSFVDTSVDLVWKEYAKIPWANVQEFTAKMHSSHNRYDLVIRLGNHDNVHVIQRAGSGKSVEHTDKWELRSAVLVGFSTLELAEQAAELARRA